jgi:hypothetical protein
MSALGRRHFFQDVLSVGKPPVGVRQERGVVLAAFEEQRAEGEVEGEIIGRILDGKFDFLFGIVPAFEFFVGFGEDDAVC